MYCLFNILEAKLFDSNDQAINLQVDLVNKPVKLASYYIYYRLPKLYLAVAN